MKCYSLSAANVKLNLVTNANLWTFISADIDGQFANAEFQFEVVESAVNFNPTPNTSGGQGNAKTLGADSEPIVTVAPEYKPYMEEGCNVAAVMEGKETDRDAFLSIAQDELSDYEYLLYQNGGDYGIIIWGTANATKTQFYTPLISQATGLINLTLWD